MQKLFILTLLVLLLLLDVECQLNVRKLPDELNMEGLKNTWEWQFLNDDRHLGFMTFNDDGTVGGYDQDNERYWSFEKGVFYLKNGRKEITCEFVKAFRDYFGKWHL